MNSEGKYRQQAKKLLGMRDKAKTILSNHKPSIGYIGEYLLRDVLKGFLPSNYNICQGFVQDASLHNINNLSKQCDVIIYRKDKNAEIYSVGDLKIINSKSVVAVIEVKSSISNNTFTTTLESFEKLYQLGVQSKFLFIYGSLSSKSFFNWLVQYKLPPKTDNDLLYKTDNNFVLTETELYDWSDQEWLPNSVLSLESHRLYVLTHYQDYNDDWVGYVSYKIKDKNYKEISCLQEFLANVMQMLDPGFDIEMSKLNIKDAFPLWRM